MDRTTGNVGGISLAVGLEGHKIIDYDRRVMRRVLNQGAGRVRKAARRLVSRHAVSKAGEFPGMDSGTLARSIGVVKRGSKGGWVRVGPKTIRGSVFYPAVLFHGSVKRNIERRGNYMAAALVSQAPQIRSDARQALRNALVPR